FVPHSSASQKVNATIMSDTEQPRLERAALIELVQLSICLEQRVLHDVFAVHDRTRHASTVAVQARTKRRDGLEKGDVARVEGTVGIHVKPRAAQRQFRHGYRKPSRCRTWDR